MKKIINTLILITVASYIGIAQDVKPPMGEPSFGFYGGINFQNINGKDASGTKLENSLVTKFHIGVNEEIPIAPEFFFQVGLQYIGKGAKGPIPYRYTDLTVPHTTTITREISMNYLEMPLNLVYKPLVGKGNFILGGGPYVGYAISGKAKYTGSPAPSDRDITFTKTTPDNDENNLANFKHLDVGGNFFFGYQFLSGFNVIFNSQLGLVDINSDVNTKLSNKNTGFGLSLGYRL